MKGLKRSVIIQNMSYVYKNNVKYDKKKTKINLLFLGKTRVEASKFISKFLKTSVFVQLHLPSTTNISYVNCSK